MMQAILLKANEVKATRKSGSQPLLAETNAKNLSDILQNIQYTIKK